MYVNFLHLSQYSYPRLITGGAFLQQHSEMSKAPGKPADPTLQFTKFTPGEKYFVRQIITNPNKEVSWLSENWSRTTGHCVTKS